MTSREFRQSARALVKHRLNLDNTAKNYPALGYFRNWYGTYWNKEAYDQTYELYLTCMNANPDPLEAISDRYALAAFLRDGLNLDEAAEQCQEIISIKPDRSIAAMNLLAFIEARRGNICKARELSQILNSDPHARNFRVREEDLLREFHKNPGNGSE
jgi:tetratricopeptide (TPR) repeat protein